MTRKIAFFEGWSWFKFNNLGLALGTNLKFCTSVAKGLKLKVRKFSGPNSTFVEVTEEKLVGGAFLDPPSCIGLRASDTYWDCLSFHFFQIIQKRILRISLIDLLLHLEFFLCSMMCYRLQSLQSLCHHKKKTYHIKIYKTKAVPVVVHQLRYPSMS